MHFDVAFAVAAISTGMTLLSCLVFKKVMPGSVALAFIGSLVYLFVYRADPRYAMDLATPAARVRLYMNLLTGASAWVICCMLMHIVCQKIHRRR